MLDTFKKLLLWFSAPINRRSDFNAAQTLLAIIKMGSMQEAKVYNILIYLSGYELEPLALYCNQVLLFFLLFYLAYCYKKVERYILDIREYYY